MHIKAINNLKIWTQTETNTTTLNATITKSGGSVFYLDNGVPAGCLSNQH